MSRCTPKTGGVASALSRGVVSQVHLPSFSGMLHASVAATLVHVTLHWATKRFSSLHRKCWPGPSAEMCRGFFVVYILEDFAGDFLEDFSGHFFPQK